LHRGRLANQAILGADRSAEPKRARKLEKPVGRTADHGDETHRTVGVREQLKEALLLDSVVVSGGEQAFLDLRVDLSSKLFRGHVRRVAEAASLENDLEVSLTVRAHEQRGTVEHVERSRGRSPYVSLDGVLTVEE